MDAKLLKQFKGKLRFQTKFFELLSNNENKKTDLNWFFSHFSKENLKKIGKKTTKFFYEMEKKFIEIFSKYGEFISNIYAYERFRHFSFFFRGADTSVLFLIEINLFL